MCILRIFLLLLLASVAGCATPRLRHAEIETAFDNKEDLTATDIEAMSGVTYQATGSLLRIDEDLDNAQNPAGTFSAASVPIVADERIYVVYPEGAKWWKGSLPAHILEPSTRPTPDFSTSLESR